MDDEKELLIKAIKGAIEGTDVRYIICEDMLGFEQYESSLKGNEYVIQKFGNYYVALIF